MENVKWTAKKVDKRISGCKGLNEFKKSYYGKWKIIFNGSGCYFEFMEILQSTILMHILTHSRCQVEAKSNLPAGILKAIESQNERRNRDKSVE